MVVQGGVQAGVFGAVAAVLFDLAGCAAEDLVAAAGGERPSLLTAMWTSSPGRERS